jgi:hypothetical protein
VRQITNDELEVLRAILRMVADGESYMPGETRLVAEMNDGGMGSLRFVAESEPPQKMGRELVRAYFVDEDGIPVSISINLDTRDQLFEMDFWRVDFSPLRRYPHPQDLHLGDPIPGR